MLLLSPKNVRPSMLFVSILNTGTKFYRHKRSSADRFTGRVAGCLSGVKFVKYI